MKNFLKNHKKLFEVLFILIVALLACAHIFNSQTYIMSDDGIQHIARAFGLKESLKYNKIFPNVISSFVNNFGYSWNLFYGPLSATAMVVIDIFVNNLNASYRILSYLALALSGLAMYKLVKKITDNGNIAVLSSVIYMTMPYRLTDMYVRNALGEMISFVFIPLVFLGLYNLFHYNEKKSYWLTIGACGLILTHNLSTVIVAIFAGVYFLVNINRLKDKEVLITFIVNVCVILAITMCFWVPLLETKMETEYQVYEPDMMSTKDSLQRFSLEIKNFFVRGNLNEYPFDLGLHVIIMLALSPMAIGLINRKNKKVYVFSLISTIVALFMCTKYFPWKYLPQPFTYIQFPWRMEMMVVFFASIISSINVYTLIKNFNFKDALLICFIAVVSTVSFVPWIPKVREEATLDDYYLGKISGKEHEVVAGIGKEEYLPKRAYENRFYIATREDNVYVLKGKALIENEEKDGPNYKSKIQTYDDEYTVLELPYIYYPGYKVTLDGMDIETFETENGFLGCYLGPKETGLLEVSYTGTDIMRLSLVFSVGGTIVFIAYYIYINNKKETVKKVVVHDDNGNNDDNTYKTVNNKTNENDNNSVEVKKEEVINKATVKVRKNIKLKKD